MTVAANPRAVEEVRLHFRAYRLCRSAEPHGAVNVPCDRHYAETVRTDVALAQQR